MYYIEIEKEGVKLKQGSRMAKVKGPALSLDASGTVGPVCYAKWRSMIVARGRWSRETPLVPTSNQEVYENMLSSLAKAWGQTLTENEREEWRERAREIERRSTLNQRVKAHGYQIYLSWNMTRLVCGLSMNTSPPIGNPRVCAVAIRCSYDNVEKKVTVGLDYLPIGDSPSFMQVYRAGPYTSPGRRAWKQDYRIKAVVAGGGDYEDGDTETGKWYWYKARTADQSGIVGKALEKKVGTI